jgi:hypothetical protein
VLGDIVLDNYCKPPESANAVVVMMAIPLRILCRTVMGNAHVLRGRLAILSVEANRTK